MSSLLLLQQFGQSILVAVLKSPWVEAPRLCLDNVRREFEHVLRHLFCRGFHQSIPSHSAPRIGSELHAYLARPNRVRKKPTDPKHAVFTGGAVSAASTVTIPGTATEAICVASYITKPPADLGKLSPFSSHGPSLDAKARPPTIAAPGQVIHSTRAYNAQDGTGFFLDMQGTSMAAPHVSGVVAAILQVNPTLKQKEIATILKDTARNVPGNPDPFEWGSGMLNAEEAVKKAKPPIA